MDIWVISHFELLQIKVLWTLLWTYALICVGYILGMELLDYRVGIYLTLVETSKVFFKVVISFSTPFYTTYENFSCCIFSPKLTLSFFFNFSHSDGCIVVSYCITVFISLVMLHFTCKHIFKKTRIIKKNVWLNLGNRGENELWLSYYCGLKPRNMTYILLLSL